MLISNERLDLQLFGAPGDGGDGAGEGAATNTVATPADDGQQKLRDLGVPEDVLRRRKARKATPKISRGDEDDVPPADTKQSKGKATSQPTAADTTTPAPTEATPSAPSTPTWDEFMAIPENNQRMQSIVQKRLGSSKAAEESLAKLAPALEALAGRYGMDPAKLDYDALTQAITDDDDNYEELALKFGTTVDRAREISKQEMQNRRETAANHLRELEQQGEALKKTFPTFDLQIELQNPIFARLTAPDSGISVEDAYFAVHRQDILTASMAAAANQSAERLSASIQSGSRRPIESGSKGSAPTNTNFSYRNASREERAALKARIFDAAARGEKVYPGG